MSAALEQTDEEALAEALAALATAAANIPAPEEESVEAKRARLELAESTAQAALDAALKRGIWENTHQARKAWKLVADELERFESEQDAMDVMRADIRERLAKIDAAQTTTATAPPPPAAPGAQIRNMHDSKVINGGKALLPVPTSMHASPAVVDSAPRALMRNSRNKVEATLENLAFILQQQETMLFGFDEFRGRIMIAPSASAAWQPLTDTDMIRLRETLARVQDFAPIGKELMRDSLQLVSEKRLFDSAITWLNGLTWDGVPRVERFLATHFGAVDDEYTRAVGLYMWTGLAGRVLEPGCQLDMVVALLAKQGTKKSTGLQLLAPFPDCFTDGLSLHQDDDDFKRLIRGKVIVEIAELAGLSKADINVVKRAITRRIEEWIEKWQTLPTTYKRRCMLFASTNEERFLPPDETGQRRWLPVEIVELNRALIAADREQLWAEGAAIWRARERVEVGSGVMYAEAERLAVGRHKKHERTDVWEPKIKEWLRALPSPAGLNPHTVPPCQRPLTLSEVLEGAIGLNTAHQDARAEKRAATVMRLAGYEPTTVSVNGEKLRRWVGSDYKGG